MVKGVFSEWQPRYAERRIATFPVNADKRPAIRRWNRITLKGSARLAERFDEADALGFQLGPRSQITALDIDSQDEATLPTLSPVMATRHSLCGLAAGITPTTAMRASAVLFDPTTTNPLTYSAVASLSPLLPFRKRVHTKSSQAPSTIWRTFHQSMLCSMTYVSKRRIPEGKRNHTLFRFALEQARHSDSYDALLDVVRTRNMDCEPPLPDDVIVTTAKSAWRYEQDGRNLVGRGRAVVTPHSVVDELIGESQDAFVLFSLLQRHHWGRNFVVANAMADQLGWTRKRFAEARQLLQTLGLIQLVALASYRTPATYRLGTWGGQF